MKKLLYKKTRLGKIQKWEISVKECGNSGFPEVWIEHGLADGKKQTTFDIVKQGVNLGKANETSPLEQANLTAERKIIKQKEEGYKDSVEEAEKVQQISPVEILPKELCFYKPKNSIDEKKLAKLEASGNAVFTVKRDGMMHIVRKTDEFGIEIYSRRMDIVTEKYPHIVKALEDIPYNFILLGEMILDKNGKDDFNAVSSICRSDSDKAIERQEEIGYVEYYVFDMAYMSGNGGSPWLPCLLTNETYISRLDLFEANIKCHLSESSPVKLCEILNYDDMGGCICERRNNKTHAEALEEVKERGLEGLVIWDTCSKIGEGQAFTFNGKAYRPNVLWKSKPKYEDDFIVRFDPENGIGEYGKGKNNGKVKSVFVYQLQDGEEILIGKCGGGLSDEQRDFYTSTDYPRVWRIEYDSIQPKTGSLRFPIFSLDRTIVGDKKLEECIISEDIREARKVENNE